LRAQIRLPTYVVSPTHSKGLGDWPPLHVVAHIALRARFSRSCFIEASSLEWREPSDTCRICLVYYHNLESDLYVESPNQREYLNIVRLYQNSALYQRGSVVANR